MQLDHKRHEIKVAGIGMREQTLDVVRSMNDVSICEQDEHGVEAQGRFNTLLHSP
jgi:hypothetical protein